MKVTFNEWKIEDQLKTAEDRTAYLMAAPRAARHRTAKREPARA